MPGSNYLLFQSNAPLKMFSVQWKFSWKKLSLWLRRKLSLNIRKNQYLKHFLNFWNHQGSDLKKQITNFYRKRSPKDEAGQSETGKK